MKKGCLIGLVVALLVPLVVVGGVLLAVNGSKRVDVAWTEADFQSYLAKGGIIFSEDRASAEDILTGDFVSIGAVNIDTHVTNAELTAILNKAAKENSLLKDIRIKFRDDGRVEASAKIGDSLDMVFARYPQAKQYESYLNTFKGKTVYISGTLERVDNREFESWVEKAYVGLIPLPVGQTNSYLEVIGTEINNILARMDGFSAEEFSFDSTGVYFKGQVPKEIKAAGN